jgi:tRNA U34 5-methylaminomethyl-2-thiouridine-forming methyltransferase MnmC
MEANREIKLIVTEDGSHSLYVPELNETYHSFHGARQESMHVFIKQGLENWRKSNPDALSCHIFEVGFGTGLNAFLALQYAEENQFKIQFTTIEPYPVSLELVEQFNYANAQEKDQFLALHTSPWDEEVVISDFFHFKKILGKLEEKSLESYEFDVVFFDAFAPNKQGELWTQEILMKITLQMKDRGVLTTYCAQGQFRRDLTAAGLQVSKVPGPPGKKEMTIGIRI